MEILHSVNDFNEAKQVIAGGLNSPKRLLGSVGSTPRFITRAEGSYLYDVDGNHYLDFVQSGGALIFGHTDSEIEQASLEMLKSGVRFGVPIEFEATLAKEIICLFDGMEKVRLVSSELEAMINAVRLVRVCSGKMGMIWFEAMQGQILDENKALFEDLGFLLISLQYEDTESLRKYLARGDIGCIVISPFGVGSFSIHQDFLHTIRELCDEFGVILIFDERESALRVFQDCEVIPDLRVLGGVFGAGMPLGILGGSDELMRLFGSKGCIQCSSDVNPIAISAGLMNVLKLKSQKQLYLRLETLAKTLMEGFCREASKRGIVMHTRSCGSMFGFSFGWAGSKDELDFASFANFYQKMLQRGIYFSPSMFQSNFVCSLMNDEDINWVIGQCGEALEEMIYE